MAGSDSLSAVDILGIISFAQGVLTLVAATFAAVKAYTGQTQENKHRAFALFAKLRNLYTGLSELQPYVQQGASTTHSEDMQKIASEIHTSSNLVDHFATRPFYERWRRSNTYAQQLLQALAEVDRMSERLAAMKLEVRLDQILQSILRQGGNVDPAAYSIPIARPSSHPEKGPLGLVLPENMQEHMMKMMI